jgi:DNA-binding response OmpR family regulator
VLEDDEASRILIVEDNEPVLRFIDASLREAGFETVPVQTGKEAFERLRTDIFDLVLLDLKLPDVDGMEILKTVRRQEEDMPLIVVSSMQEVDTKVLGFEIGCDDYITKPFHVSELIGRVRRLLRRTNRSAGGYPVGTITEARSIQERIEIGEFQIDLREVQVYKNGKPLHMRKKLFDLFLTFARNPGMVLSKEALYQRAWDDQDTVSENSLYVHLHQLRTLVEDDPTRPEIIKTVRGMGFLFTPDGTE